MKLAHWVRVPAAVWLVWGVVMGTWAKRWGVAGRARMGVRDGERAHGASGSLRQRRKPLHGFTLIELLVVTAVVALSMALVLPALRKGRDAGRAMVCLSNLKQITLVLHAYGGDHRGWIPPTFNYDRPTGGGYPGTGFYDHTAGYMGYPMHTRAAKVHVCPGMPSQRVSPLRGSYGLNQFMGLDASGSIGPTGRGRWWQYVHNHATGANNTSTGYYNLFESIVPAKMYLVGDVQNGAEYYFRFPGYWHNQRFNVSFHDGSVRGKTSLVSEHARYNRGHLPWLNRTCFSNDFPDQ